MVDLEVVLHKVATITMGTSPKGTTYNREGIGLPLLNGPTEFGEIYIQSIDAKSPQSSVPTTT